MLETANVDNDEMESETRNTFLARKWGEIVKQHPKTERDIARLNEEVRIEEEKAKVAEEPNDAIVGKGAGATSAERRNLPVEGGGAWKVPSAWLA